MRVDVVTIFPEFFSVLDVSLLGRARTQGLIDVRVTDLRDFTHDRHRTVDDTPYGGGAGMVMRPEPWGEALDVLLPGAESVEGRRSAEPGERWPDAEPGEGRPDAEPVDTRPDVESVEGRPVVVFPTPAGVRFTQSLARELAAETHLVFCCGRYEGIDQRVVEHAAGRARTLEVSLGDYVLNGGEVAALAMIEAVGRLVPGMVGNPASLMDESHEHGLLEAPSYTKPAIWRGLPVPPVLLSGDHGAVAAWRRERSLDRTRRIRPDLLEP